MTHDELNEARTNPEFLEYLEKTRVDAINTENISALYEVLDTMLILDLDEEKINSIYENILKIAFESVEKIVNDGKKLSLDEDDLFYVRSFYEHAIEKWSRGNNSGAKELFFVLGNILNDTILVDSLNVHLIACSSGLDLDTFYEKEVNLESTQIDEKYGYFIVDYNFNTKEFLKDNSTIIDNEFKNLKHLLD